MTSEPANWATDSICLDAGSLDPTTLAASIYERTCRTNFDAPGFCVVNAGPEIRSVALRRLMVEVKREMAAVHESTSASSLAYLSVARFDQQETTRPHLDGGPEECFLMLGYEPSEVDSELEIFDYAKCAFDLGLSPEEFMTKHNPMFESGLELLLPYSTVVPCFSKTDSQIICINNSSADYSETKPTWQGTLHTAKILSPDPSKRRVINSTMIASVELGMSDEVNKDHVEDFVTTSSVRRRGYDKRELEDDA